MTDKAPAQGGEEGSGMTMRPRLCVDLCCGLKGFSSAFAEAGWEVVTVDIDPKFSPTIVADITTLGASTIWKATKRGKGGYGLVVVLASPPCQRFSLAPRVWPKPGIRKALEIVGACIELMMELGVDYFCLENPSARLRWFIGCPDHSPELGNYGYRTAKKTDLWTNIPFPLLDGHRPKKSNNHHAGPRETWQTPKEGTRAFDEIRDPSIRAKMPPEFSKALLQAITGTPPERGGLTTA